MIGASLSDLARLGPDIQIHVMLVEDANSTHVFLEMDAELAQRTRWMASFHTRAEACCQIEDLGLLPSVDVDRIRATGSLGGNVLWLPSVLRNPKQIAHVFAPFAVTPWN